MCNREYFGLWDKRLALVVSLYHKLISFYLSQAYKKTASTQILKKFSIVFFLSKLAKFLLIYDIFLRMYGIYIPNQKFDSIKVSVFRDITKIMYLKFWTFIWTKFTKN